MMKERFRRGAIYKRTGMQVFRFSQ